METLNKVPNGVLLLNVESKKITYQNTGMTRILDVDSSRSAESLEEFIMKKKVGSSDRL